MTSSHGDEPSPAHRSWSGCLRGVQQVSGWLLTIYAIAQFTGTHWPNPPAVIATEGNDKLLHFGAYFGLACLITTWRSTRAPVTLRTYLAIWTVIIVAGVLDEITQMIPRINRQADFSDWIADVLGATSGLLVWHFLLRPLFPSRSPTEHDLAGKHVTRDSPANNPAP